MKNTTENNKLIAEFMGWKEQSDPTERFFGDWLDGHTRMTKGLGVLLSFHCSWDWLIPVVEKIERLTNENFNLAGCISVEIGPSSRCDIVFCENFNEENEKETRITGLGLNKIEATYNAVIKFIKWYNENKKVK